MATQQISLELFMDSETRVFAYAKCGNDFVDVLLSFLTVPIGTIIRLTPKDSKIGSMRTLYESLKDPDLSLPLTEAWKNMLLYPKNASEEQCKDLKVVNIEDTEAFDKAPRDPRPSVKNVFVEQNKEFIIKNDLRVFPCDSEKVKTLISKSVANKNVNVGKDEVLHLFKRSLLSETPLTDMIDAFHLNDPAPPQKGKDRKSKKVDTNSKKVSVKLTVNKSNKKVVYAEGGEEFTDLLFSFLAFPLGFVAKFFGGDSGVKCLDNLYRSVQVLKKFIESKECEGLLVDPNDPKLGPYFSCKNQPLQIKEQNPWQPTIIGCVCSKVISGRTSGRTFVAVRPSCKKIVN